MLYADDLDVSPDIFEYFLGTLPLLQADPTLWCVSAWNDNGKINLVDKNAHDIIYRTDFFPGLGWMLTKSLWNELSVKWPRRWVSNTWYGWTSLAGVHSSLISSFVKILLLHCKELYYNKNHFKFSRSKILLSLRCLSCLWVFLDHSTRKYQLKSLIVKNFTRPINLLKTVNVTISNGSWPMALGWWSFVSSFLQTSCFGLSFLFITTLFL